MSYPFWPAPSLNAFNLFKPASPGIIEGQIRKILPGSIPVLFPSGRAAIRHLLEFEGIHRGQNVGIGPYASGCIYDCVGTQANPLPSNLDASFDAHLVYHQWGIGHTVSNKKKSLIIEDSVDSFIENAGALFPNKGKYEVISFSKIIGLPFGAAVFCRDEDNADALRSSLKRNEYALSQFMNAALGVYWPKAHVTWSKLDNRNGAPHSLALPFISARLEQYTTMLEDTKAKYDLIKPYLPKWLKAGRTGRIPVCVPIECSDKKMQEILSLGFSTEQRRFNSLQDQSKWDLKSVLPLPIHNQVPLEKIERVIEILKT